MSLDPNTNPDTVVESSNTSDERTDQFDGADAAIDVARAYFGPNFLVSPQPMVLFSAEFRILAVNDAARRLTGHIGDKTWVGGHIGKDALSFADPTAVVAAIGDLYAGGRPFIEVECEIKTLHDEHKNARIAMQAIRDQDGNVEFVAGYMNDVTDLRWAERVLAEQLRTEETLNQLGASLTELNTLHELLDVIAEGTADLARSCGAERAFVWQFHGDSATMSLDWSRPGEIAVPPARRNTTYDAWTAASPAGLATEAARSNAGEVPGLSATRIDEALIAYSAPVFSNDEKTNVLAVIGICVRSPELQILNERDIASVADLFGRTWRTIRRNERARQRDRFSRFISDIGANFLAPDVSGDEQRIQRSLSRLGELIGAHHVQLRNIDWSAMVSEVSVEYCAPDARRNSILDDFATIDLKDPGMREIAANTEPHQFHTSDYGWGSEQTPGSLVVLNVPLVVDEQVTATLNAVARGHDEFSADEIWVVHTLAGLIVQLQRRLLAEAELRHRLELEDMVRSIAIDFNELTSDTIADGLDRTLRRIGQSMSVDRVALCHLNQSDRIIELSHEWVRDPSRAVRPQNRRISSDDSATVALLLNSVVPLFLNPHTMGSHLAKLLPPDIQIAHVPIVRGGRPLLSIDFEAHAARVWTDAELGAIRSISALVVQLDARVEAERSVLRRLELEDITRLIATDFLDLGSESSKAGIELALERLGPGLKADRVSLWRIDQRADTCSLRVTWSPDGIESSDALEFALTSDLALRDLAHAIGASVQIAKLGTLPITMGDPDDDGTAVFASLTDNDGTVQGLIGFERSDATPWSKEETGAIETVASMLVQLEARLEAEEHFTIAFENAPVGVTMRDEEGRLLACNQAYEEFIGATQDEMIGQTDERFSLKRSDAETADDTSFRRQDGTTVWARVSTNTVRHADGGTKLILSHIEDTTEQRQAVEQLEYRASHDELTGLVNRRVFLDEVKQCLSDPPNPSDAAILLLDLDRFKVANDSLGHSAGDDILRTIANRLRFAVRPGDVVSRLGGDEFVVLLRGPVDELEATTVADRLLALISKPIDTLGGDVQTSCSVGIAFPSPVDASIEDVMRHADAAMYQAKNRGRDRFVVFDQEHREALSQRVKLERELRVAVDKQNLELFFQPEIELNSGRIVGAEGLIRWRHPELGLMSAGAFIEIAEESGIVVDLGRFVLNQACRQAAEWNETLPHDFMVRANVSARQLERTELVTEVKQALRDAGIDASQLCLEITETAIMNDVDDSLRILNGLKDIGVRLAIDDFGTGFSSLAYLKRFPVDVLKIDQAFVRGLGTDPDDEAIVRSVLNMAEALDLDVVAEGIETDEQRQMLVDMGCFRGQGFGLVRPAHPVELEPLLRRGAIEVSAPIRG